MKKRLRKIGYYCSIPLCVVIVIIFSPFLLLWDVGAKLFCQWIPAWRAWAGRKACQHGWHAWFRVPAISPPRNDARIVITQYCFCTRAGCTARQWEFNYYDHTDDWAWKEYENIVTC